MKKYSDKISSDSLSIFSPDFYKLLLLFSYLEFSNYS